MNASYSEAAYFDGYAFQHIADWQQRRDRMARDVRDRRLVLNRIRNRSAR